MEAIKRRKQVASKSVMDKAVDYGKTAGSAALDLAVYPQRAVLGALKGGKTFSPFSKEAERWDASDVFRLKGVSGFTADVLLDPLGPIAAGVTNPVKSLKIAKGASAPDSILGTLNRTRGLNETTIRTQPGGLNNQAYRQQLIDQARSTGDRFVRDFRPQMQAAENRVIQTQERLADARAASRALPSKLTSTATLAERSATRARIGSTRIEDLTSEIAALDNTLAGAAPADAANLVRKRQALIKKRDKANRQQLIDQSVAEQTQRQLTEAGQTARTSQRTAREVKTAQQAVDNRAAAAATAEGRVDDVATRLDGSVPAAARTELEAQQTALQGQLTRDEAALASAEARAGKSAEDLVVNREVVGQQGQLTNDVAAARGVADDLRAKHAQITKALTDVEKALDGASLTPAKRQALLRRKDRLEANLAGANERMLAAGEKSRQAGDAVADMATPRGGFLQGKRQAAHRQRLAHQADTAKKTEAELAAVRTQLDNELDPVMRSTLQAKQDQLHEGLGKLQSSFDDAVVDLADATSALNASNRARRGTERVAMRFGAAEEKTAQAARAMARTKRNIANIEKKLSGTLTASQRKTLEKRHETYTASLGKLRTKHGDAVVRLGEKVDAAEAAAAATRQLGDLGKKAERSRAAAAAGTKQRDALNKEIAEIGARLRGELKPAQRESLERRKALLTQRLEGGRTYKTKSGEQRTTAGLNAQVRELEEAAKTAADDFAKAKGSSRKVTHEAHAAARAAQKAEDEYRQLYGRAQKGEKKARKKQRALEARAAEEASSRAKVRGAYDDVAGANAVVMRGAETASDFREFRKVLGLGYIEKGAVRDRAAAVAERNGLLGKTFKTAQELTRTFERLVRPDAGVTNRGVFSGLVSTERLAAADEAALGREFRPLLQAMSKDDAPKLADALFKKQGTYYSYRNGNVSTPEMDDLMTKYTAAIMKDPTSPTARALTAQVERYVAAKEAYEALSPAAQAVAKFMEKKLDEALDLERAYGLPTERIAGYAPMTRDRVTNGGVTSADSAANPFFLNKRAASPSAMPENWEPAKDFMHRMAASNLAVRRKAFTDELRHFGKTRDEMIAMSAADRAGWRQVELPTDKSAAARALNADLAGIHLPNDVADTLDRVTAIYSRPEEWGKVVRSFQRVTSWYKRVVYSANPGHIPTDFLGNMSMMLMRNPRAFFAMPGQSSLALKIATAAQNEEKMAAFIAANPSIKVGNHTVSGQELITRMRTEGVLDAGYVTNEVTPLGVAGGEARQKASNAWNAWQAVGAGGDNLSRSMGYLAALSIQKGGKQRAFTDAGEELRKAMLDYGPGGATAWEQGVARNIVPFYTFMRQSLPQLAKAVLRKPAATAAYGRAQNIAATDMNGEPGAQQIDPLLLPGYASSYMLWGKDGDKARFIKPKMPDLHQIVVDPDKGAKASIQGTLAGYLSATNPIIKYPFEFATGRRLGASDIPIEDDMLGTFAGSFGGSLGGLWKAGGLGSDREFDGKKMMEVGTGALLGIGYKDYDLAKQRKGVTYRVQDILREENKGKKTQKRRALQ